MRGFSAALLALLLFISPVSADPTPSRPTEQQITQAIEQLERDPNLAREHKETTLKWREQGAPQRPLSVPEWFGAFVYWMAQSVRLMMWMGVAVLVATVALLMLRYFKNRERIPRHEAIDVPTHVRDLDIRPENLPDDIGAEALGLWNRGERRAALALLNRGLLSRLVHVHAVPIKASSTEGDCLQLVRQHLAEQRVAYAGELIGVWQRAVYGAHDPDSDDVRGLCVGFDAALGANPSRLA